MLSDCVAGFEWCCGLEFEICDLRFDRGVDTL